MRTTINLPDGLAEAAKKYAADHDRTFTSVVEEGLRVVVDRPEPTDLPVLPTHGSSDDKVLVDLSDNQAIWEILDEDGFK